MNNRKEVRNFFISRFLLIITFLSLAQAYINTVYHNLIYPLIEQFFHLEHTNKITELEQIVRSLITNVLYLFFSIVYQLMPSLFTNSMKKYVGDQMEQDFIFLILQNKSEQSGLSETWYVIFLFLTIIILIVLWLAPYILAAIYFSYIAYKKISQIEEEDRKKQNEFEQQKSLLLSDIAHDLKTPMTTIVGYSQALMTGVAAEKGKETEYLKAINQKANQMNELLNLLFDYVKLDSSGFKLTLQTYDLNELVREIIANMYTDFEKKNIALEIAIPEHKILMSIDWIQLGRAIQNLLVNAIKHNQPEAKVLVRVEENDSDVRIHVSDDGELIKEETAFQLFEPFVQGDSSRTGKRGSGLGLSITKKIVNMHHGDVILRQHLKGKYRKEFLIILEKSEIIYQ